MNAAYERGNAEVSIISDDFAIRCPPFLQMSKIRIIITDYGKGDNKCGYNSKINKKML